MIQKQTLILAGAVFGVLLISILLLAALIEQKQQKKAYKHQLEILESQLEQQKQENINKVEVLEAEVKILSDQNQDLKQELQKFENSRALINRRSDEKKATITRITTADSLYGEIARHYK